MKNIVFLFCISLTLFNANSQDLNNPRDANNSKLVTYGILNDSLKIELKRIKHDYFNKEYLKSLKSSLILLDESKKNRDFNTQIEASLLIGDIFTKINSHEKALIHYKSALNIIKKRINESETDNILDKKRRIEYNKYSTFLIKSHLSIGSAFYRILKKNDLEELDPQKDSAKTHYKKAISIRTSSKEALSYKARAYSNLSGIYFKDKKYDEAKEYAQKAVSIHQNQNEKIYLSAAITNLASIYLLEKDYKKARKKYYESLNLIEKDTTAEAIKLKEGLYLNLAFSLYKLKDYTAYDFQKKSYKIKDGLRDKEIRRMIEEVYAQQKVSLEKEKANLIKNQAELKKIQESKTTLLFGALSLLIIMISGVVVYNYKLRQKNLQLKLSETDLLQQQSIEKLKSDAQTKILNATIDGKETERKQIAETLHDNVSALLSSANMHLSATKKQFNGDAPQEIEKTREIILEASQKVRDLSHNLISSILLKFGLEYALKDVVKKYSNSQLKFEVAANNINRYNQEFEIKIFNVIQELINNIIKHSKASNAQIILKGKNNQLTILVKDDGVGFTTSSSSINDGIGLNQIEARIKVMNGKLTINSELNKGTEVFIMVPIQQQKQHGLSSVS